MDKLIAPFGLTTRIRLISIWFIATPLHRERSSTKEKIFEVRFRGVVSAERYLTYRRGIDTIESKEQ
jgi:hypothetical protein